MYIPQCNITFIDAMYYDVNIISKFTEILTLSCDQNNCQTNEYNILNGVYYALTS